MRLTDLAYATSLMTLLACTKQESPVDSVQDTGDPIVTDTQVQDSGLPDEEVFIGAWELVRVDDTDGVDDYPIVEESSGCLSYRGFTLNVDPGFSGNFVQHLRTECPGQSPVAETLGTYEMKGAYIIDRTFTIRIKDWELALTCVVPEDDDDSVRCDGNDDSGPLILDFERGA